MSHTASGSDGFDRILQARLRRRQILRAAIGAGMLVPGLGTLLAACGGGSEEPTSPAGGDGGQASATTPSPSGSPDSSDGGGEGKRGGIARIVTTANPASWDLTKSTWATWQGISYMYDRLLTFNEAEELQPGLAVSWEFSDDGLEYLLNLREGVTFHDGEPFNAEAVKFNIQRHIDQPDSAFYATYEPVDRVEVIDEHTVKIVLKEIEVFFPYTGLAQWGALQLSPKAYGETGETYSEHPVGTGPFKFESYEPGSSIKFVRNDDYWGGAPLLDGIEVRIIPESSVQLIEMEAGTVDYIQAQPKDVELLQSKGMVIESTITPGAQFISLNVSKEPTSELAVRKAIALAIDRDTIIDEVLFGYAEKSRAGVNSQSPFYHDDIPMIEYDPERAGAILDEAGWVMGSNGIRQRDGKPLFVNILSAEYTNWGLLNQIIQEQLKVIGIDSQIQTLEWNAYLDQWRENQGDWHVTFHSQGSITAASAPIQASWAPSNFWTITQIDDATTPELQELAERLEAINQDILSNPDPEARKALAREAQMLFQENQLTVWLWHAATISAIQPRLKGYWFSHAGRVLELDKAWIEE